MKQVRTIYLCALLLTLTVAAGAQTCTTAVCNAKSPAESDVLAALPSSSNTNSTVVVKIPAGTASWTSQLNYTVPSAVTNLTIQGTTTIAFSGTAGTASYSYSVTDGTIIQDAYRASTPLVKFTINGTDSYFRMTGLTIEGGNIGSVSYTKGNGILGFTGNSTKFRLDHCHFNNETYSPSVSGSMVQVDGSISGVMDHNVIDLGNNRSVANGFQAFNPIGDNIGFGDGTWANRTPWGTSQFLYIENNYFNGGVANDCGDAGTFVMRYNTLSDEYIPVQDHPTKSSAGAGRGCRAYEAYHNYITGPGGAQTASGAIGLTSGTALIWGNTLAGGYNRFFEAFTYRNSPGVTPETNTPAGWGYCGATVNNNGVGSAWDGNQPSIATGYPCLDGLGRGQTRQALNGKNFPDRLDSVTGTVAWPQQYLEPVYLWDNSIGAATYVLISDLTSMNNRDYYYDCGLKNISCPIGFTGGAGTGYGTLADRPSTCTAGPGGTYGASPTGSYGVAYFATDANGGQGELYVCSSTNTWTPIYEPYTYPHPLVTGAPSMVPDPPTLSGTAH